MEMRRGRAHGVFLKNSNGMDVILNTTSLTYKVIGGKEELQVSGCGKTILFLVSVGTAIDNSRVWQCYI